MDVKTQKKAEIFLPALESFEAVLQEDISNEFMRDSAIQRFEYTIEIFWKLIKSYLESEGISVLSPRDTIKKACSFRIITEEESEYILEMLRYRNETSHDYAMSIAKSIAPKLKPFAKILRSIFAKISV